MKKALVFSLLALAACNEPNQSTVQNVVAPPADVELDVTNDFAARNPGQYQSPIGILRFSENRALSTLLKFTVWQRRTPVNGDGQDRHADCEFRSDGSYQVVRRGQKLALRMRLEQPRVQAATVSVWHASETNPGAVCEAYVAEMGKVPLEAELKMIGARKFALSFEKLTVQADSPEAKTVFEPSVAWPKEIGVLFARSSDDGDFTDYLLPILRQTEAVHEDRAPDFRFDELKRALTVFDYRCALKLEVPLRIVLRRGELRIEGENLEALRLQPYQSARTEEFASQRYSQACSTTESYGAVSARWLTGFRDSAIELTAGWAGGGTVTLVQPNARGGELRYDMQFPR
jgi:hypothetical protein